MALDAGILEEGIKKLKDVLIGDFIYTKEGYSKVSNVFIQGIKECVKITTVNNCSITATLEHKIDTRNGLLPLKKIIKGFAYSKYSLYIHIR